MRKVLTGVSVLALCVGLLTNDGWGANDPGRTRSTTESWWCQTTSETTFPSSPSSPSPHATSSPVPNPLPELDTMEPLGVWLHGTARPMPGSGNTLPYYDYYVGYDTRNDRSVYIDIDPAEGKYFVGTSPTRFDVAAPGFGIDRSTWNIQYPAPLGTYTFQYGNPGEFTIQFTNFTQACHTDPEQLAATQSQSGSAATPTRHLQCATYTTGGIPETGGLNDVANDVTITKMPGASWWQGVGTTGVPPYQRTIYEYNIFNIGGEWVAVDVNAMTGDYFIAKTYKAPNIGDTTWTVVYPTLEDGFSFANVTWEKDIGLPTAFDLVFADGVQRCW